MPADANVSVPGFALAAATRSADGLEPALGGRDQNVRRGAEQDHRHEIFDRVIRQLAVQHGFGRHRGRTGHQRVAIGVGPGHGAEADRPAGAGLQFDDHRLADELRHLIEDHAGHGVRGASGRVGADHADGSIRILLRIRGCGGGYKSCGQGGTAERTDIDHVNTSIPDSSYQSRRARANRPASPNCRGRCRDARIAPRSWRRRRAALRAVRRRLPPFSVGSRRQ